MENETKLKYTLKMTLLPSHFDMNDKIKAESIFSIFQDVASFHGELMGIGFLPMLEKHLYWIVSRVKFDILIDPQAYQEVVVETWPHQKGKVDFDRDYLIKNLDGEVLVKGTSKWCVISTETRKLELPSSFEYPEGEYEAAVNYEERFVKTPSVKKGDEPAFSHQVSYHEIDHNLHLNNVFYTTYVFDAVKAQEFKHLQINFIQECRLGDIVDVYTETIDAGNTLVSG